LPIHIGLESGHYQFSQDNFRHPSPRPQTCDLNIPSSHSNSYTTGEPWFTASIAKIAQKVAPAKFVAWLSVCDAGRQTLSIDFLTAVCVKLGVDNFVADLSSVGNKYDLPSMRDLRRAFGLIYGAVRFVNLSQIPGYLLQELHNISVEFSLPGIRRMSSEWLRTQEAPWVRLAWHTGPSVRDRSVILRKLEFAPAERLWMLPTGDRVIACSRHHPSIWDIRTGRKICELQFSLPNDGQPNNWGGDRVDITAWSVDGRYAAGVLDERLWYESNRETYARTCMA
jgi:hypothetical protein